MCSTSERTLVSTVIDFCYVLSQWQLLLLPVFLPVVFGFICPPNEDLEALTEEREEEQDRRKEQAFSMPVKDRRKTKVRMSKNKTDIQHHI